MNDPYQLLGVPRTASAAEVKQAYRKLAKKLHPDMQQGKTGNEQRFKDVTAAYDLLSDPDKRARFDRGEIDASGAERAPAGFRWSQEAQRGRGPASGPGGASTGGSRFNFEFADDIFSDLFGRGRRTAAPPPDADGQDIRLGLRVPFLEAVKGGKRPLQLPDGRVVNVTIPAGTEDGQQLRLRGQAPQGMGGGDVYVTIEVEPHPDFTRQGADILSTVPVTLAEAVLGATIRVDTVDGQVGLKVPPGANHGRRMRLRGKGLQVAGAGRGDHYVTLAVTLPEAMDDELRQFVEGWSDRHPYRVRPEGGAE
ncbi:DnaJ-like protein [Stella humosa]|uniref:DnaJ-like protein n=1 Tax=Stella humosa TaxID=94 RepID=A0A3N1KSK4_9PROT|nr:J domain-containing protein [Stella humosa]ROP81096.1 DnaJ-like protein [Stella humosa]BBK29787.1 molecular chaperone DnaJ [Stella humosa]